MDLSWLPYNHQKNKHKFPKKKTCHGLFLPPKRKKHTHTKLATKFPPSISMAFLFHRFGNVNLFVESSRILPAWDGKKGSRLVRGLSPNSSPPGRVFGRGGRGCSIGNPKKKTLQHIGANYHRFHRSTLNIIELVTLRIDFTVLFYDDKMGTWKTCEVR